jgi:hypothetical protein
MVDKDLTESENPGESLPAVAAVAALGVKPVRQKSSRPPNQAVRFSPELVLMRFNLRPILDFASKEISVDSVQSQFVPGQTGPTLGATDIFSLDIRRGVGAVAIQQIPDGRQENCCKGEAVLTVEENVGIRVTRQHY